MENTQLAKTNESKFSVKIQTPDIQQLIQRTLGDPKRAQRFIGAISSVVATNPALQKCDANTLINGALVGEALNLAPSPQLGHYYLVPFEERGKDPEDGKWKVIRTVATFILGYKGYIQLAIRSGQYRKINVLEIKKGELVKWDPLNEEIQVKLTEDDNEREAMETIGYYATFEYINGFKKAMYWTYEKMLHHAATYSKAFNLATFELFKAGKLPPEEQRKTSSFWYKQFDEMAKKTLIRQLISKWGIMSIEMQEAFANDETIQDDYGNGRRPETVGETVETVKDDAKSETATQKPPVVKKEEPKPEPKSITDEEAEKHFEQQSIEIEDDLPFDVPKK